jgi:hypothetical protein
VGRAEAVHPGGAPAAVAAPLFFRIDGETLRVTRGPDAAEDRVSFAGLGELSALRWCAERDELLALAGGRLVRWRFGSDAWDEIAADCLEATCVSGGYAVLDEQRLVLLEADGRVVARGRAGNFDSLAANPSGDRVAWIRWRGDDRRICTQRVGEEAPREHPVSCYGHAWLDDRSIVFYLGSGLRVLDVESGRTSTLARSVVAAARGRRLGHRVLDRYLGGSVGEVTESFQAVAVAGGRVWFAALVSSLAFRWAWLPRFHGLFSVDREGRDLRLVTSVPRQEQIRDVVVLEDGSAVLDCERYRRMRVVARPRRTIGPLAEFLADGWEPLAGTR